MRPMLLLYYHPPDTRMEVHAANNKVPAGPTQRRDPVQLQPRRERQQAHQSYAGCGSSPVGPSEKLLQERANHGCEVSHCEVRLRTHTPLIGLRVLVDRR